MNYTINDAIVLLERLEKKAAKSLQGKALISAEEIEKLRRLLSMIKSD